MENSKREELLERNNKLTSVVLKQIEEKCPGTVDLIGIAGSFCNGNFYEKSDLDLVIISNDVGKSAILNNCFILDDVGYDIYVSDWSRFEHMARYDNCFVTKLKQLDIVYIRDDSCLQIYRKYQDELNRTVNDDVSIKDKVNKYYDKILFEYKNMTTIRDNSCKLFYKKLGLIMSYIENIIYLMNKEYVHGGTKNILDEIRGMKSVPANFVDKYLTLLSGNNLQIIDALDRIIKDLRNYYNLEVVDITNLVVKKCEVQKKKLSGDDLIGTYEELFSNYYNKMYHAIDINSRYLSFRTMVDAQNFFDEIYVQFDISDYNLIGKYNPNNLEENANNFVLFLSYWKSLYDSFDMAIKEYNEIEQIYT